MAAGRSSLVNMQQDVYICEVDSRFNYERIPRMITISYYDIISERVLLIDPFDNGIEVRVEKQWGLLHFTGGWGQIREFYNLRDGGWIRLRYLDKSRIRIDVQDPDMSEIVYLMPPRILKLGVFGSASKMEIGQSSIGRRESMGQIEKHRWFYAEYDSISSPVLHSCFERQQDDLKVTQLISGTEHGSNSLHLSLREGEDNGDGASNRSPNIATRIKGGPRTHTQSVILDSPYVTRAVTRAYVRRNKRTTKK